MDPHTARCLQLSTSISMPFNSYRPHRFPDPMNRSRYHASNPVQRVRPARSNTMPSNTWSPQQFQNLPYQQPTTTPANAQHAYSKSQTQLSAMQTAQPQAFDFDNYFTSMSPDEILVNNPWNTDELKPLQTTGLGMQMTSENFDMTPIAFSATTTDSIDELISPESDLWNTFTSPSSPDRRSWSTLSSGDASELPEMTNMPALNMNFVPNQQISFETDNTPRPVERGRAGRSTSRPPPSSRANSSRRYRTSPYPATHTRSSSAMSLPSNGPCHSRAMSQSYVSYNDFGSSTFLEDVTEINFSPVDGTIPPAMDFMSMNFEPRNDFDAIFENEPLIAPKPQHADTIFLSSNLEDSVSHFSETPATLPSSNVFDFGKDAGISTSEQPQLDSSIKYADEPDLFGRLSETPLEPPESDMNPADPDMKPTEQETRFEGDLYTPKYVRGHGNKREGWCGHCKGGRWLVLKNSAFWYDKSFTHGISAATGMPFDGPRQTRRMAGNPDVWEGLCGSCDDWIALISSKKKGTTWFRHAYKCHTHQKAKDGPRRRRESCAAKTSRAASMAPVKTEEIKREEDFNGNGSIYHVDAGQNASVRGESALQSIGFML